MLSKPMSRKVLSYLDIYIYKGYLIFFPILDPKYVMVVSHMLMFVNTYVIVDIVGIIVGHESSVMVAH